MRMVFYDMKGNICWTAYNIFPHNV